MAVVFQPFSRRVGVKSYEGSSRFVRILGCALVEVDDGAEVGVGVGGGGGGVVGPAGDPEDVGPAEDVELLAVLDRLLGVLGCGLAEVGELPVDPSASAGDEAAGFLVGGGVGASDDDVAGEGDVEVEGGSVAGPDGDGDAVDGDVSLADIGHCVWGLSLELISRFYYE